MTTVEALEMALSKEKASIRLYQDLSIKHSGIKDLLIDLVNEEQKHKHLIEKKIAEVMRG